MKKKFKAGCGKCKTILIEEVDGFPLGFLWCPKCDKYPEKVISIEIPKKIVAISKKSA